MSGDHVFFPGGYRSPVLNELDALYRECVLLKESWTADDIRLIAERLAVIDSEDHGLVLARWNLERARKARQLALRTRNNVARGTKLINYMLVILETARSIENVQTAETGRAYLARQADKSEKGWRSRWKGEERDALGDIISALARRRDELGDYMEPHELWTELYGELDDAGLAPKEHAAPDRYTYADGREKITYEAFRKRIQRLRQTG